MKNIFGDLFVVLMLMVTFSLPLSFLLASGVLLKLTLVIGAVVILMFWAVFFAELFEYIRGRR